MAITSFSNDLYPLHILYQGANTSAHKFMIISNQNANRLHYESPFLPCSFRDIDEARGKWAQIVVPRSGSDLILIRPPTSWTRSCIPVKPQLIPCMARFC